MLANSHCHLCLVFLCVCVSVCTKKPRRRYTRPQLGQRPARTENDMRHRIVVACGSFAFRSRRRSRSRFPCVIDRCCWRPPPDQTQQSALLCTIIRDAFVLRRRAARGGGAYLYLAPIYVCLRARGAAVMLKCARARVCSVRTPRRVDARLLSCAAPIGNNSIQYPVRGGEMLKQSV